MQSLSSFFPLYSQHILGSGPVREQGPSGDFWVYNRPYRGRKGRWGILTPTRKRRTKRERERENMEKCREACSVKVREVLLLMLSRSSLRLRMSGSLSPRWVLTKGHREYLGGRNRSGSREGRVGNVRGFTRNPTRVQGTHSHFHLWGKAKEEG